MSHPLTGIQTSKTDPSLCMTVGCTRKGLYRTSPKTRRGFCRACFDTVRRTTLNRTAQQMTYFDQRARWAARVGLALVSLLLLAAPQLQAAPMGLDLSTYQWTGQGYADNERFQGECSTWFSPFANVGSADCFNSSGNPEGAVYQTQAHAVAAGDRITGHVEVANLCLFQCAPGMLAENTSAAVAWWMNYEGNSYLLGILTPGVDNTEWHGLDFVWTAPGAGYATLTSTNLNAVKAGDDFAIRGVDLTLPTTLTPVPEPASLVLLGCGLAGLTRRARRRQQEARTCA